MLLSLNNMEYFVTSSLTHDQREYNHLLFAIPCKLSVTNFTQMIILEVDFPSQWSVELGKSFKITSIS